jgi:hypothetical protein
VGEGASRVVEARLLDVSSNGTFVNSEPVGNNRAVRLQHGDRISVVRPLGASGAPEGPHSASMLGYILFRERTTQRPVGSDGASVGASTQNADNSESPAAVAHLLSP